MTRGQPNPGSPTPQDDGRSSNSLRLTGTELSAVREILDKTATAETGRRRQSARLAYSEVSVPVDVAQPGGGQTRIVVACRNLSQTGIAFLHSAYLHVGTKTTVTLRHRERGESRVPGTVVRCRHVMRHIHEVGVRFDQTVNVRDFVQIDSLAQSFTCETVDPAQLKGTLLIVDEYKVEAGCIQSMLRETGLEFVTAADLEEGLKAAVGTVDIILCDHLFTGATAMDFVVRARRAGVRCPIVIMSGDRSPEVRQKVRESKADGLLVKPLDKETLFRGLAEFLLVQRDREETNGPIYSSLPADSPMVDLADTFAADLRAVAEQLRDAAAAGSMDVVRRLALKIAGPAPSLGFDPIAKLAAALITSMAATGSLDESAAQLNQLITACRHVRARAA